MDEIRLQALAIASKLTVHTGVFGQTSRPATVDEIVEAAARYASFMEGNNPTPAIKTETLTPAVPVEDSITPDYIICLDDGAQKQVLTRHLRKLGMTPAQYRVKWGLPSDYPMTAPNYAAVRSKLAKELGLGTKRPRRKSAAE